MTRCFECDDEYLRRLASWAAVSAKSASRCLPLAVWRHSARFGQPGQRRAQGHEGREWRLTLHDVVGVGVNEHGLDDARAVRRRREHLVEQAHALLFAAVDDALLDDVGSKLLLREWQELAKDLGDDERAVRRVALLEDPLDDVLRRERGQRVSNSI